MAVALGASCARICGWHTSSDADLSASSLCLMLMVHDPGPCFSSVSLSSHSAARRRRSSLRRSAMLNLPAVSAAFAATTTSATADATSP